MARTPQKVLAEIAQRSLGIDCLETRNVDSLDCHTVSADDVREALDAAYRKGFTQGVRNALKTLEMISYGRVEAAKAENRDAVLSGIARRSLGLDALVAGDEADYDVSVACVREALEIAYQAGCTRGDDVAHQAKIA